MPPNGLVIKRFVIFSRNQETYAYNMRLVSRVLRYLQLVRLLSLSSLADHRPFFANNVLRVMLQPMAPAMLPYHSSLSPSQYSSFYLVSVFGARLYKGEVTPHAEPERNVSHQERIDTFMTWLTTDFSEAPKATVRSFSSVVLCVCVNRLGTE